MTVPEPSMTVSRVLERLMMICVSICVSVTLSQLHGYLPWSDQLVDWLLILTLLIQAFVTVILIVGTCIWLWVKFGRWFTGYPFSSPGSLTRERTAFKSAMQKRS